MSKRIIIIIVMNIVGLFQAAQAQKKEKSISAGLFISFPSDRNHYFSSDNFYNTVGLEVSGQYNFTNKSAIVIQSQLSNYNTKAGLEKFTLFSIKGGYRYQFTNSGFYVNILGGIIKESGNVDRQFRIDSGITQHVAKFSSTLGAGKRFIVKQSTFIDAGIESIADDGKKRINIKADISILRRPKIKINRQ
ncbi:MAG TPA: hypothetical protein VGP55_01040 [Chitinophagaceae bacterium]|nr:hypothetical protein [Chitinophagaceae bacterium]